jgi:hypothetical protein
MGGGGGLALGGERCHGGSGMAARWCVAPVSSGGAVARFKGRKGDERESGGTGAGGAVGTWEAIPWQSDTRRWRQADGGSYCVAGPRKKKIGLAGRAE